MQALLVIDVQNGIVNLGYVQEELSIIESLIMDFKENGKPVIFIRHLDDQEESPLYQGSVGSELHSRLKNMLTVSLRNKHQVHFSTQI